MFATFKDWVIKNKLWIGIVTVIYTVLVFIFSGNLRTFKGGSTNFMVGEPQRQMSAVEVLKDCFNIGNFEVLFFFFSVSIICCIYFWNKDLDLREIISDKSKKVSYFKNSLSLMLFPIATSIILNILARVVMVGLNQDTLVNQIGVTYASSVMTYGYMAIIGFFAVSVSFLFQVSVKSRFSAAIMPLIIFESLILVFGISGLFASKQIPALYKTLNGLSDLFINYTNLFRQDLRIEMLGGDVFFNTLLAIVTLAIVCLTLACRYLMTFKYDNFRLSYRFSFTRRITLFSVLSVVIMYSSLGILAMISLFDKEQISLDRAYYLSNVISVVAIPVITFVIEFVYMKRNDIKFFSWKKKKVEEEEIEIKKEVLDRNLKDKGIVKETFIAGDTIDNSDNILDIDEDRADLENQDNSYLSDEAIIAKEVIESNIEEDFFVEEFVDSKND